MDAVAVVILVCSLSTPGPECGINTAVDVVRAPRVSSLTTCQMHGQAQIAGTALVPGTAQYLKVICQRQHNVGEMPVAAAAR